MVVVAHGLAQVVFIRAVAIGRKPRDRAAARERNRAVGILSGEVTIERIVGLQPRISDIFADIAAVPGLTMGPK